MKKSVIYQAISIILLIAWAFIIFAFSSQNATQSSDTSNGVVEKIIEEIYPQYDNLTKPQQTQISNTITTLVRKGAHFLEYFILGALAVINFLNFKKIRLWLCGLASVVFCCLYAVSDEIHQYFVPGRACKAIDVCIDTAGAATATVFILLIKHISKKRVKTMRKKKLIEQNLALFENLQKTKLQVNELQEILNKNAEEIKNLKAQLAVQKEQLQQPPKQPPVTEPMRKLEEKILLNATLKPDVEYGAKVIGKLVISAAEYSNRLSIGGDETRKELINLILGKTEMTKAEILSVVEDADSLEAKYAKMDQIAASTDEYFKSVIAQIV